MLAGFSLNSLKVKRFQPVGFKYQRATLQHGQQRLHPEPAPPPGCFTRADARGPLDKVALGSPRHVGRVLGRVDERHFGAEVRRARVAKLDPKLDLQFDQTFNFVQVESFW